MQWVGMAAEQLNMTFAAQNKSPEAGNWVGGDSGIAEMVPVCRSSDKEWVLELICAAIRDICHCF